METFFVPKVFLNYGAKLMVVHQVIFSIGVKLDKPSEKLPTARFSICEDSLKMTDLNHMNHNPELCDN